MKIELEIHKRHLYLVAFLFSFVFGVVMAGAFNPTDPNSVGHPIGDLTDANGNLNIQGTITAQNVVATNTITAAASQIAGLISGQWILSGSDIYYLAGDVGIGITDPLAALHVSGDALVSGSLGIGIGTVNPTAGLHIMKDGTALNIQSTALGAGSDLTWLDESGSAMWAFSQRATTRDLNLFRNGGGTPVMAFERSTGDVGIGKNPTAKLDVAGDISATGGLNTGGDATVGGKLTVAGNIEVTGEVVIGGVTIKSSGVASEKHSTAKYGSFGGAYGLSIYGPCMAANPITGACSCPSGYTTVKVTGCSGGLPRCGFICVQS